MVLVEGFELWLADGFMHAKLVLHPPDRPALFARHEAHDVA
jgi:hypothetical protein